MSNSLETDARGSLPAEFLSRLRDHDNPFDDFVQARRPGGAFSRRHVPAVNRTVFEKLLAAIDRYRLDATRADQPSLSLDDVPRSGVLLLLGPRGAGKTHLVHALRLRETGALVIAPTYFEPHRPFAEYLLQLLVRGLQEESRGSGATTLQCLADWFARQTAAQALFGMTDTQWLARSTRRSGSFWRGLLGWSSRGMAHLKELLTSSLLDRDLRTIHDVCRFREHEPDELRQIALHQVTACETSRTIGGQIRLGLYTRLVQLAFDAQTEPVFEFLFDGFTRVEAQTFPSRETLVEELLAALVELFLLFGQPVVFAFDALESLLSDPPDEKRCHDFFRGLANVLDSHRGLPMFVFAEAGHWQQAQRYISNYAQQRLQQGVPTRGHGSLRQLDLPCITADDLEQLVAARLSSLLESHNGHLPPDQLRLGPFHRDDLAKIARSGADTPPLRQMLQALRDVYQQRVFGDASSGELGGDGFPHDGNGPALGATVDLQEVWQREFKLALRRIESEGLGAQAGPVQMGLQKWLEHLAQEATSASGWTPVGAEIVTFGNHPTHGQLTRCRWRAGSGERESGIAFLLGQKAAMPADLKAKLQMMASQKPVVESLVILWPHDMECAGPAEKHLPTATRKVWDDLAADALGSRVTLRAIEPRSLAAWLAIEPWQVALREEGPLPLAAMRHFLAEVTGDLLPLLVPNKESRDERVAAGV